MKTQNDVVRLPLWKACLDDMREEVVEYSKVYSAEFFEEKLKAPRDSMQFSLGISKIRHELKNDGFYLSGRGQKGNSFVILPPESNADVMRSYSRAASQALSNGVILGTNTRLDSLTPSQRKKHESLLEKMAVKAVLMQRSKQVFAVVTKVEPKLLI